MKAMKISAALLLVSFALLAASCQDIKQPVRPDFSSEGYQASGDGQPQANGSGKVVTGSNRALPKPQPVPSTPPSSNTGSGTGNLPDLEGNFPGPESIPPETENRQPGQSPAPQNTTPQATGPVTVFKDCNFIGSDINLAVGRFTLASLNTLGVLNDDISSLRVRPGFQITLFEGDNFQGASIVKTADDGCLVDSDFNDRVSSIIVERETPAVTLFKDCNFSGPSVILPAGDYTLADLQARGVLNEDISSLRVARGRQISLYAEDNFGGAPLQLDADAPCLVDNDFNDITTSLRIR